MIVRLGIRSFWRICESKWGQGGREGKPGTARLRINREVVEYDGGELSITRAMALVFLKQADTNLRTLVWI